MVSRQVDATPRSRTLPPEASFTLGPAPSHDPREPGFFPDSDWEQLCGSPGKRSAAAATAAAPGWQRDSEGVATFQGLSSRSHADFIADLLMRVPQGSKAPSRASTTSSTAAFGMESATLQSIDILAQDPYADGGPMSNASSKQTHLSHSTLDLQERAGASADTQEASSPGGGGGGTEQTTVMIRNLPVSSSQDRVVKEMDLEGKIDFLYLPRSGAGQTNLGYAFINFVNDEFALQFQEQWHKQRLPDCPTRKSLNISFATIQGLRANVMQVKKKRRRCLEVRQCHPIIMMHGRQVSLDEALDIYNGKAEPLSAGAA
eukprot:CAMPEP_0206548938 /NCGR_PEP_ID=MMETSP0325_2-20121206/14172_1 /ASSEMBLY_ACC=CAM_ASM_000347 /TAXON_ID=2866 /ORGANISM="Crypthecodinium cohnii, Strain Seligo" /LENGTH=316 /DNA_ID=CAMNT_0054048495 /DNA_START=108 /DNA_END=1058 /DNA_ORIENTATION=-